MMTNLLENNTEYPAIDESEADQCRALWMAVAVQAVIDARSHDKDPKLKRERDLALKWLEAKEGEKSDFAEVCSLAGLDFQATRSKFLELLRTPSSKMDFRCLKRTLMENRGMESRSIYMKRIKRRELTKQAERIAELQCS